MLWGLKPVKQQAAHGLATDRLRRPINQGLLLPGERLAPERRLAEQIGISRVTLREALSVLEAEGLVTIRRGAAGGAFVASEAALRRIMLNQYAADPAVALRIEEYRTHAEPEAARLAAIRRTPADLKKIDEAIAGLEKAANAGEIRHYEAAFHLSVAQASGNPLFAASIEDALASLILPFPDGNIRAEAEASQSLREEVAKAIQSRHPEAARSMMMQALAASRVRMPVLSVA